ncbi:extracellular solute-binding protein [Arachnia propionica]|uniref:Extracellular solute-binding protein n=1 Tax=Arachnia propionica TaxID=1750 RepID=A0A3P1T8C4_9ACTN|nr:extracellular solute-binding protein [Arachnia propionica]MDO5084124.1 extracellular solute-binding protein [Arachnia propionica]RRD05692.1 extracellular solute-binding protein [Arachnia propionica]
MSTINRRSLLTLTAGAVAGTMAACGGSSGKDDKGGGTGGTGRTLRVWFMEGSISDAAVTHLKEAFAAKSPGNSLEVEVQPWEGVMSKLQTGLSSATESPDLVETGNTQSSTFSSVGAFAPVDDLYEELGGSRLIPSFVEAGSWEGVKYALPLYAGARGVYYRKDLFDMAGIAQPTTLDEFADAMVRLTQANPEGTTDFSALYLAAGDEHSVTSLWFAGGGEWAVREGDRWVQQVSSPESLNSLRRIKRLFSEGTKYAVASQASQQSFDKFFNEGKVAVLLGTGNITGKIDQALWEADKVAVMPIPGLQAGEVGKTFSGGSTIAIAKNAQHPDLAKEALRVIFAPEFQKLIAADGWVPGNTTHGNEIPGAFGEISQVVVENSKLTPNTPQWGVAEGKNLIVDFWTEVAQSDDIDGVALKYGQQIEDALNS